jgi:hypothetical protein
MTLSKNQVVKLRNGRFGVTACFNDKPFQLIFTAYTTPINRYDNDLKHKNSEYDIVEIFDGSSLEKVTDVFKRNFTTEGLESVWVRED